MPSLPLPPTATTNRELLRLARRIERMSAHRRELLARVVSLEEEIRVAKRNFRALTDLIAAPIADTVGQDELAAP